MMERGIMPDVKPEPICPLCNKTKDRPATMLDDAYSVFKCPHPFHWNDQDRPEGRP